MSNQQEQLNALNDIRKMMDRSSRFISLSGLSGIFAGVTALVSAYFAHGLLAEYAKDGADPYSGIGNSLIEGNIMLLGAVTFMVALFGATLFTMRQSRKKNLPIWDKTAKNLLINLAIPLLTGGVFILALLYNQLGSYGLIAPSCLLFYGLALLNAGKYTYSDIRFLGICEIILGLISLFNIGYGLYFWAFGFGILHILYGLIMYFKYERVK
ncbi:MAG: hypothetical protein REI78_00115 [Pedobacter sp.]|nr:hypothetical protein [Pedobacter sp.]MDQ8051391.1 hypothetical protein [Pedobacter sp.]